MQLQGVPLLTMLIMLPACSDIHVSGVCSAFGAGKRCMSLVPYLCLSVSEGRNQPSPALLDPSQVSLSGS